MDKIFKILCASENDVVKPKRMVIMGRVINLSKTCGQVLDTTFTELCDTVSVYKLN